MRSNRHIAALAAAAAFACRSAAQEPGPFDLSLEELGRLPVTSVSRRPERVGDAPAAVYVITDDDIRRAGVTSLPEALRLAPSVEVARNGAHSWAISIRGFNNELSNKLLVLVDGRSVYTPLYGGVFWDAQDTLLEDVERIEVVAGPGGAVWGANAVNGVINVITRSAWETRSGFVSAGSGTERNVSAGLRYGGTIGERLAGRGYVKYFDEDASEAAGGGSAFDDWRFAQAGFRGHHLRAAWEHHGRSGAVLGMQAYFDHTERAVPAAFSEDRDTLDLDFQYRFASRGRHDVVVGAGYRVTRESSAIRCLRRWPRRAARTARSAGSYRTRFSLRATGSI